MRNEFDGLSGRVIGAGLAVHRALGPGFLESTYQSAFRTALNHRGIEDEVEFPVQIVFEGVPAGLARIDLVVARAIVVELKATDTFSPAHFAQLRSYLRATSLRIGLLMNFNTPTLSVRRVVLG